MHNIKTDIPDFRSVLGKMIRCFILEKRALGLRYIAEMHQLKRLDDILLGETDQSMQLTRQVFDKWIGLFRDFKPVTTGERVSLFRQLAFFLLRQGIKAHAPDSRLLPIQRRTYVPYVFTHNQIKRLFTAAGHMRKCKYSPLRHIIMPMLFRLLYCCGLRVSEAIRLKVKDVEFPAGRLVIRNTKFGKDRLIIMADDLTKRMRVYHRKMGEQQKDDYFFPSPEGGGYGPVRIYLVFRQLLEKIGITHGGRGRGPRLHDLRTTFAVHRMMEWYREGDDLNAKLPVLATFLGHRNLFGTQRYLHLTLELFGNVTQKLETQFGDLIPENEVLK